MRRLWTTAAAAALCVFAASAWGAPSGGQLELVAVHHHLRGSQDSETTTSRHHKAKSESSSSARRKAKSESASSSRHERRSRTGRRHGEAASEETAPHARGRKGRHHTEPAAEAPARGRHGRHAHVPSEIRTESGGTVEVGRHDTLESISRDTGVTIPELAKLNHLRKPFRIRKGAKLKLPERRYYVVKRGDTISGLARKFGVESSELAAANDLSRSRALRSGQKFYLPGSAHEAAPPEEQEAPPPERPSRRPTPPPPRYRPPSIAPFIPAPAQRPYAYPAPPASTPAPETDALNTPPASTLQGQGQAQAPAPAFQTTPGPRPYQAVPPNPGRPIIQSSPAPTASDVATAGKGKFIWPVNGQVIQGFGPKADGQRNDGLNIQAGSGDPVRAAADGEVVYAGDQVPSFGNLVLIKHAGGWVTAYAHMARIMVRNRDTVVQGQQIGVVGQTGQVDRPQLHFEIRYAPSPRDKAIPVDPALVLPEK
jgi:murein DD-endopeptidase MepM/ murein hydrolase activator NlpD